MSSISGVASGASQPLPQAPPPQKLDTDGDHDQGAAESASDKTQGVANVRALDVKA